MVGPNFGAFGYLFFELLLLELPEPELPEGFFEPLLLLPLELPEDARSLNFLPLPLLLLLEFEPELLELEPELLELEPELLELEPELDFEPEEELLFFLGVFPALFRVLF